MQRGKVFISLWIIRIHYAYENARQGKWTFVIKCFVQIKLHKKNYDRKTKFHITKDPKIFAHF